MAIMAKKLQPAKTAAIEETKKFFQTTMTSSLLNIVVLQ